MRRTAAVICIVLAVVASAGTAAAAPSLRLEPETGRVGDRIAATGSEMGQGPVELRLDSVAGILLAEATPVRGNLVASFVIPSTTPGRHDVVACRRGSTVTCQILARAALAVLEPAPPPTLPTTRPTFSTSPPPPPPSLPPTLPKQPEATPTVPSTVPSTFAEVAPSTAPGMTAPGGLQDPNAEPVPDLRLTAIEITQGIQDLKNRMPLVADRRTWIRLHVAIGSPDADLGSLSGGEVPPTSSEPLENVDGAILMQRGNASTVIYPENAPITAVAEPNRVELDSALNFIVPPEWDDAGSVTFTALVWSPTPASLDIEPDASNNEGTGTRTFHEGSNPEIILVPLDPGEGPGGTPSAIGMADAETLTVDSLLTYHPLSAPVTYTFTTPLGPGVEADDPETDAVEAGWYLDADGNRAAPNMRMAEIHALWNLPNSLRFLGIVANSVPTGNVTGYSKSKYFSAWAKPKFETAAHELGHQRGLAHVPCDDEDGDGQPDEIAGGALDPSFPIAFSLPNCSLAPIDPAGFYGFATYADPPVISSNDPASPAAAYPLMSYKGPKWIDPYHYCKLLKSYGVPCSPEDLGLKPKQQHGSVNCHPWPPEQVAMELCLQGNLPPPVPQQLDPAQVELLAPEDPSEYALMSLSLHADATAGAIHPFYVVESLSPELRGGYDATIADAKQGDAPSLGSVVITDARGLLLVKVPVDLGGSAHGDGVLEPAVPTGTFELVPWPDGAARVDLVVNDKVVASQTVSPNPPTVELLAPTSRASLARTVEVQWDARDADGDPVQATLEWSGDGGATWRPAAIGLRDESFVIDDPTLPGGDDVRVRVRVTDGTNTAIATSDRLRVADASPQLTLTVPSATALHAPVLLLAQAVDPEDGVLDGDAVRWRSSLDGRLGTGRLLEVRSLSAGTHDIIVTAIDSTGARVDARAQITVTDDGRRAPRVRGALPAAEARLAAAAGAAGADGDGSGPAWYVLVAIVLGGALVMAGAYAIAHRTIRSRRLRG